MKNATLKLLPLAAAALLATTGMAQTGADDCSMADPIMGTGQFMFDTTGATGAAGSCTVNQDVWFVWTAPSSGDFVFDTCTTTSYDSKIAVYPDAMCGGADIACNDDACGLQSLVSVSGIVAGNQYLIELGTFSAAGATGVGTLTIGMAPDCSVGDAMEDNDDCASGVQLGSGSFTGLNVDNVDEDFYYLTVAPGDTLTVDAQFLDAFADLDIFLYQDVAACQVADPVNCTGSLACGFSASDNELIMYTNPSGVDETYVLKVRLFAGTCNGYDLNITGADGMGGGVGMPYCTANANSAGTMALIRAEGSSVAADQDLTLITEGVVPGVPGLYFFGPTQIQVAFGNGFRCAGGATTRIQPPIPADGMGTTTGVLNFAAPYGAGLTAGTDTNFQLWYRDNMTGAGFNLSNGLNILFQ